MRHFGSIVALAVWCGAGQVAPTWAVVQTIDATADASVLQFLPDEVVNSDSAFESLDESTANFPLIVEAHLRQENADAAVVGAGTCLAVLSDPRAGRSENPAEFGFDLVAFSLDPSGRYDGRGLATESREIVFAAEEIGVPDGTTLEVTSHFFLNGYLVIWGDLIPAAGITSAEVVIRVEQFTPGTDGDSAIVLETTLRLSQGDDGAPLVTAAGALTSDSVLLVDTLGSLEPLGQAFFAALPEISIPYSYPAVVGEAFTLNAQVECRISNQPFTGAAITLGLPLEHFFTVVSDITGEPVTRQGLFTATGGTLPLPGKPLRAGEGTVVEVVGAARRSLARPLSCGILGAESLLAGLGFSTALLTSGCRRSRARPPDRGPAES